MRFHKTPSMRKVQKWLDKHPGDVNIDDIAEQTRTPREEIARGFKRIMRRFLDFYDEQDAAGRLRGSPTQKWMEAIINFKANFLLDVFIYDKPKRGVGNGEWVAAPKFVDFERRLTQRATHWVRAGQAVVKDARRVDAVFIEGGKAPEIIERDLKLIEEKLLDGPDAPRCPTCGDNIEEHWQVCPVCEQQLK